MCLNEFSSSSSVEFAAPSWTPFALPTPSFAASARRVLIRRLARHPRLADDARPTDLAHHHSSISRSP